MDGALADILEVAVPRNRERDVTGLLAAHRGWFIQALEGPPDGLRELAAIIRGDPRHEALQLLTKGPIAERMFPDWNLCARVLSDADTAVLMGFDNEADFDPMALSERTVLRLLAVVAEAHRNRFSAQQKMVVRRQ